MKQAVTTADGCGAGLDSGVRHPSVVIFAVGNPSRGDDALGPCIAMRLAEELAGRAEACFEVIEDFQLQVEHALDLDGRDLALFIDAGTGTPAPFRFARLEPAREYGHTSHALAPEAVLQVYRQSIGREPPPAFLLVVRGESFDLGEALTPAAQSHLEAALSFIARLAARPGAGAWENLVGNS